MNGLELRNITKVYQDGASKRTILAGIDFTVAPGELVAVVGPSGSGKSTFLSIAGALLAPTSGTVKLAGRDITPLSQAEWTRIRREQVGFIFQNAELIPYLTARDQLLFLQKLVGQRDDGRADALLTELGLAAQVNQYPHQLSGGERQRVAIARAFMNNPQLILADEPTASLDSKRGRQVVDKLHTQVHEQNAAAIMVTHDERILDLADRVYHINDGSIREISGAERDELVGRSTK